MINCPAAESVEQWFQSTLKGSQQSIWQDRSASTDHRRNGAIPLVKLGFMTRARLRGSSRRMADLLSPSERGKRMSRIWGKNTRIETLIFAELEKLGVQFSTHVDYLEGRPDILIEKCRLLEFVDGDFWHGRRYTSWKHKLTPSWDCKIENNIRRDRRQRAELRREGWQILQLWGTDVLKNSGKCAEKVLSLQERYGSKGVNRK
jgi:DNA mismatch endonuclease (patch repair protein)